MSFYIPPGSQPPAKPEADTPAEPPATPPTDCDDHGDIPDEIALLPRWLLVDPAGALVCGVSGYLIEGDVGPDHWAALDHVIALRDGTNGGDLDLAFALGEHGEEAFVGLVLRNCLLADEGYAAWALHLLGIADSYTECVDGGGLQCIVRVPADEARVLRATLGAWRVKPFEDGLAELQVDGVLRLSGTHRPPFPDTAPQRAGVCAALGALLAPAPVPDDVPVPEVAPVPIELSVLTKDGGPLTKRISLDENGAVVADGSACVMSHGAARRVRCDGLAAFGALIGRLGVNEALALGVLRDDLPDQVTIVTKAKLNGGAGRGVIARTHEQIVYRPGQPALALIDFDSKGMPPGVKARVAEGGSVWAALVGIVTELGSVGRVIRPSTSSGLYRSDTGEQLPGSQNQHIYVLVRNGADIERFLRCLHDRCWLAGYGWFMVGAGGQLLERSIIDRMVGAPERLVFEGPPILTPPVVQDTAARMPTAIEGGVLDTIAACRPLTLVEQSTLRQVQARERQQLKDVAEKARTDFITKHAVALSQRTGMPEPQAEWVVEGQCKGILLPDVILPFDDPDLACCTVADVVANPERFEGATLADPLEGVAYGVCKARIMRRSDGTLWIHSFAHGRTRYELKLDAAAARKAIESVPKEEVARTYLHVVLAAEMGECEVTELRRFTAEQRNLDRSDLRRMEKEAREQQRERRAEGAREQRIANRADPRPQLDVPRGDAEWLPVMNALNEVLGAAQEPEPPMRDPDGVITAVRSRSVPDTHLLTSAGANDEEPEENRLPPAEQPLLTRLAVPQVAELIERYIEFTDPESTPVHLPTPFVTHYVTRPNDDALPIVTAIATLPVVLPNGTILSGGGLNREHGIVFRVPRQIEALLPNAPEITDEDVRAAIRFLAEVWFCDVATDNTGKYVAISAALSIIVRALLPERPVFTVTAGRRGGGKTTLLIMLLRAITGVRPAAAAWSANEEERRKALVSYLEAGVPAIIWDNMPRGLQFSCPNIERACTTLTYQDRRLGVNELITVLATAIQFFTGNNIAAKGDLASRNLNIRLDISRADPENRVFQHPDPIGWTEANRGKILRALYTILLGNPRLRPGIHAQPKTRFKAWWHLIGSAVEHAAGLCGTALDFKQVFLSQEADDEESASLGEALDALAGKWPGGITFTAREVAKLINDRTAGWQSQADQERGEILREVLFLSRHPDRDVSAKAAGKRLRDHVGNPVRQGDQTLVLSRSQDTSANGTNAAFSYTVTLSK